MSVRKSSPSLIFVLVTCTALVLGGITGSFFTERHASRIISSIPASPVVVDAIYNRQKHSISYSIMNPGGVPLTIVEKSFVFTPGNNTTEKGYVISHIPDHSVLPPGIITKVELKLKKGTEKMQLGDAVLATFTYTHPLSEDLYSVIHPFKIVPHNSGEKTEKKKR